MAKISARGANEVARFRHRQLGFHVLVRSDGAVLTKGTTPGDGWKLVTTRRVRMTASTVPMLVRLYRTAAAFEEVPA